MSSVDVIIHKIPTLEKNETYKPRVLAIGSPRLNPERCNISDAVRRWKGRRMKGKGGGRGRQRRKREDSVAVVAQRRALKGGHSPTNMAALKMMLAA